MSECLILGLKFIMSILPHKVEIENKRPHLNRVWIV
jgi:hypothetical protein